MIDKIKELAIDVYKELGMGYEETVYEKAMEIALRLENIPYEKQRILSIFYKGFFVGTAKPDLIVKDVKGNEKIILELKAVSSALSMKEEAQLGKYLERLKMKSGIIINFPQLSLTKGVPEEPEIIVIKQGVDWKKIKAGKQKEKKEKKEKKA